MKKTLIIISACISVFFSTYRADCFGISIDLNPGLFFLSGQEPIKISAHVYHNQAIICCQKGLWDKAVVNLTKALEVTNGYSEGYYYRGIAFCKMKHYARGIEDFNKAIELDPGFTKAYYRRGIIYKYLRQYDKAISDFNKILELNPEHQKAKYEKLAIVKLLKNMNKLFV